MTITFTDVLLSKELPLLTKIWMFFSLFTLVLSIICVISGTGMVVYWKYYDNPKLFEETEEPRIITPGPYHPGQMILIERTFCMWKIPNSAEKTISNTFNYPINSSSFTTTLGCGLVARGYVPIPGDQFHKGMHIYSVTLHYKINPLVEKIVKLKPVVIDVE